MLRTGAQGPSALPPSAPTGPHLPKGPRLCSSPPSLPCTLGTLSLAPPGASLAPGGGVCAILCEQC